MPEGLAILLGKKPPKSDSKEKDKGGDEDAYTALASGMMKAFKKGDEKALASLLRDCDFLDHGDY